LPFGSGGGPQTLVPFVHPLASEACQTMPTLAWRSFAWFVSEPDYLLQLHYHTTAKRKLAALL
jgi:hypothetical protein